MSTEPFCFRPNGALMFRHDAELATIGAEMRTKQANRNESFPRSTQLIGWVLAIAVLCDGRSKQYRDAGVKSGERFYVE